MKNDAKHRPISVVLAAGNSTRFDGIKMLAPIAASSPQAKVTPEREPMLLHVVSKLSQLDMPLAIALGKYREKIEPYLPLAASVIICPDASMGLGKTISNVVAWIQEHPTNYTHLFLCLGDAPAIQIEDYQLLLTVSQDYPKAIICSENANTLGAPAIFPKSMFEQLANLDGDQGAKAIINQNKQNVKAVFISRSAIDIDTHADLKYFHKNSLSDG